MTEPLLSSPGFGQADLSNCEREQIHLAGSIQPHGALLVLEENGLIIVQISDNAVSLLDLHTPLLDRALKEQVPALAAQVRELAAGALDFPAAFRSRVGARGTTFECHLHRLAGGGLILELEPASFASPAAQALDAGLRRIASTVSLQAACDETARLFKEVTGYDRVMVYRFDEEGHGEVFAEDRELRLEAFLGNRYPSSDIPQIARQLYMRNRIRVLVDVAYEPVALSPRLCPLTGRELDMSLCLLRSMSPIHIQYLKNMGVGATLVVSLVVAGKLWGLIACHHYSPRVMPADARSVCEILAEAVATRIAALEGFIQAQAEIWVRRLEQRMIEAISRDGDWRIALFDGSNSILAPVNATGAALLFEDQIITAAEVPGTQELREIGRWLDEQPRGRMVHTASFALDVPRFAGLTSIASGFLAVPIASQLGEYLIWFRPERVRTVTWGGNPFKAINGTDPATLSPRRSFAQWHQLVEGTSDPWLPADLVAARLIRDAVADVVLQFRSVRMLIAQDQLERVRGQVHESEQPVLIVGRDGRVLAANDAFAQMIRRSDPLQRVEDLLAYTTDPAELRHRLQEMLRRQRNWRGEIQIEVEGCDPSLMMLRADAVFARGRLLGYVLLFTDLDEQRQAQAARRSFQEQVMETHRILPARLESSADLVYRNLLSSMVESAQLAALEITDGADMARVPVLLEGLKASVARVARTLQRLIHHS